MSWIVLTLFMPCPSGCPLSVFADWTGCFPAASAMADVLWENLHEPHPHHGGNESIYLHRSSPLLENGLDRPKNRYGRYGFPSFYSISISTVGVDGARLSLWRFSFCALWVVVVDISQFPVTKRPLPHGQLCHETTLHGVVPKPSRLVCSFVARRRERGRERTRTALMKPCKPWDPFWLV